MKTHVLRQRGALRLFMVIGLTFASAAILFVALAATPAATAAARSATSAAPAVATNTPTPTSTPCGGSASLNFAPPANYGAGSGPQSVAVGDFNGDGNPDLAVANFGDNNVSILLGNGAGGFGAATNFAVGIYPQSVAVGDFNGDG